MYDKCITCAALYLELDIVDENNPDGTTTSLRVMAFSGDDHT